jgi:hypothetical protein
VAQPPSFTADVCKPIHSSADDLAVLNEAQKLYQKGEHCRQHGKAAMAIRYYEAIRHLCPGSNFDQMAAARLTHLHAATTKQGHAGTVTPTSFASCSVTQSAAQPQLVTRVFPVADLVVVQGPAQERTMVEISGNLKSPVGGCCEAAPKTAPKATSTATPVCASPAKACCKSAGCCNSAPCCTSGSCCKDCCTEAASQPTPSKTQEERLIRLFMSTVAPETWSINGGPATMDYYPLGMSLVARNRPDVLERIEELLTNLRRQQDVEVALEMRCITVPESFCHQLGMNFKAAKPSAPDGGVSFLNDKQVFQLLEAVQACPQTNVLQAPKLTVFNGQESGFSFRDVNYFVTDVHVVQAGGQTMYVPDNQAIPSGFQMSFQPVVSPDRRFVRVKLSASLTCLTSPEVPLFPITTFITPVFEGGAVGQPVPFTQYIQQPQFTTQNIEKTVNVPDGGTVLMGGFKRQSESRNEFGPPILSKIPYINRLFKNVGYSRETETMLIMLTPRIIINEEDETRQAGCQPPKPVGFVSTCTNGNQAIPAPPVMPPAAPRPLNGAFNCWKEEAEIMAAKALQYAPCHGLPEPNFKYETVQILPNPPQPYAGATPVPAGKELAAQLLKKYHQACSEGRLAEAKEIAVRALALDPACFSKGSISVEVQSH